MSILVKYYYLKTFGLSTHFAKEFEKVGQKVATLIANFLKSVFNF